MALDPSNSNDLDQLALKGLNQPSWLLGALKYCLTYLLTYLLKTLVDKQQLAPVAFPSQVV